MGLGPKTLIALDPGTKPSIHTYPLREKRARKKNPTKRYRLLLLLFVLQIISFHKTPGELSYSDTATSFSLSAQREREGEGCLS